MLFVPEVPCPNSTSSTGNSKLLTKGKVAQPLPGEKLQCQQHGCSMESSRTSTTSAHSAQLN